MSDHVKAFVRIRPSEEYPADPTPKGENGRKSYDAWDVEPTMTTPDGKTHDAEIFGAGSDAGGYKFNDVFVPTKTNKDVFAGSVLPVVDSFIDGKNGCVACYGQTGSGKTHTIFGYSQDDPGVVLLALSALFEKLRAARHSTRFRLAVSFYEIYCEKVNDLLEPASSANGGMTTAATAGGTTGTKDLSVREVDGVAFVQDLSIRMCDDLNAALKLVEKGNTNKTIGNSYVHDKSSRAHTVFSVQLARERRVKDVVTTQLSRLNFVDLAGSEALSDKFGSQQQDETKAINLSLGALRRVIDCLATKEGHVPYRESVLTRLLAPSLSMNSVTSILCMMNAATKHESMSTGALRFGNVSRAIEQKAVISEFIRAGKGGGVVLKEKIEETTLSCEELAGKKGKHDGEAEVRAKPNVRKIEVPTRQGAVQAWIATPHDDGETPPPTKYALCLHAFGGGCEGGDWNIVFEGLCHNGYTVLSPDMPGFGTTPGTRHTSRTERFSDSGGPIELVFDFIEFLTNGLKSKKVLLVGWDWGGNLALATALGSYRNRISAIAVYHPSWTDKLDLLHSISHKVLLLWEPKDQLHLYSTGKRMAGLIPNSKLATLQTKAGKERSDTRGSVWAVMEVQLIQWVEKLNAGAKKPAGKKGSTSPAPQEKKATPSPPPEKVKTAGGVSPPPEGISDDDFTSGDDSDDEDGSLSTQSSFLACLLSDPVAAAAVVNAGPISRRDRKKGKKAAPPLSATLQAAMNNAGASTTDEATLAVFALFKELVREKSQERLRQISDALLRRNDQGAHRPVALRLTGNLPVILPHSSVKSFIKGHLWSDDAAGTFAAQAAAMADLLATTPQYPVGRRVLCKVSGGVVNDFLRADFGASPPTGEKGNTAFTYKARIAPGSTAEKVVIALPSASGQSVQHTTVNWSHVVEWNIGTKFPQGPSATTLQFEDAIMCRYHDIITRTKVGQCAVTVESSVKELAMLAATGKALGNDFLKLQIKAVRQLWSCIDMIHHVAMGKDPKRLCVPDAGRLATHGQWHCHGMASVFAAFLLPFTQAIGLEVRYRDGFFCHHQGRDSGDAWNHVPRATADHTWLEVTFYPSAVSYCCDPSFAAQDDEDILTDIDWAYSSPGCRFPVRNLTSASAPTVPGNIFSSSNGALPGPDGQYLKK